MEKGKKKPKCKKTSNSWPSSDVLPLMPENLKPDKNYLIYLSCHVSYGIRTPPVFKDEFQHDNDLYHIFGKLVGINAGTM